jgi:DNA-binding NarL/FixJ family response regulator
VAAVRTVMITVPRIFRDLTTELMAGRRDLHVVAEFGAREGLEEPLRLLAPELILVGLGRNESDEVGLSLLHLLPAAKIIAFSSDGHHAFVHRMQPQRAEFLNISPQMLIDAILGL